MSVPSHRSMVIYGRNPVREAGRGRRKVRRVWANKNILHEQWLTELNVTLEAAEAEEIERRCGSPEHQGVCAEVSGFVYAHPTSLLAASDPLIVALDQVQDPHNLGAVCRTAECAGASGVVIPERRSAEVTPAVCKASAGAVEHLPIARVRNLADFLQDAKRAGLWCYGADAGAELSYDAVDYGHAAVLVIGSEGKGLRPRVVASCDALVAIPLRGRTQSLNLSSAAAVLLYAATAGRT